MECELFTLSFQILKGYIYAHSMRSAHKFVRLPFETRWKSAETTLNSDVSLNYTLPIAIRLVKHTSLVMVPSDETNSGFTNYDVAISTRGMFQICSARNI